MNLLDNIEPDGGGEDGREREGAGALTLGGEDRDGWSSGHFLILMLVTSNRRLERVTYKDLDLTVKERAPY